jgi:hypothetical protein
MPLQIAPDWNQFTDIFETDVNTNLKIGENNKLKYWVENGKIRIQTAKSGEKITLTSLNGHIINEIISSSVESVFTIPVSKGAYILKVGSNSTKIILK